MELMRDKFSVQVWTSKNPRSDGSAMLDAAPALGDVVALTCGIQKGMRVKLTSILRGHPLGHYDPTPLFCEGEIVT